MKLYLWTIPSQGRCLARGSCMNENSNQDRFAREARGVEEAAPERTAFHLRKAGLDLGRIDDDELKQVPVVGAGTRLQQGATYADLTQQPPQEFTARADMRALPGDAYAPKDRVPYEIWNRLIGEEKPGQG
jgi:hypothetical protein